MPTQGQTVNTVGFEDQKVSTSFSSLQPQTINVCTRLCANKTLFTKPRGGPDVADGVWFADCCFGTACDHRGVESGTVLEVSSEKSGFLLNSHVILP